MAELSAERTARLSAFLHGLDELVAKTSVEITTLAPDVEIDGMSVGTLRNAREQTDAGPGPVVHYVDVSRR